MHDAVFLGPKAENADLLERLLTEVLRDHVFWRRNYHPADPRLITEETKRSATYERAEARLRDELFQILAELKRGAPLFSPRQVGHMVSDPTLPALVGYFAGLLYNQNNVVAEAAPETVRKEGAYVAALARMVGYPPLLTERLSAEDLRVRTPYAWGHLASGGTVANIEAMWLARNVRLYPLAVRLLAASDAAFGGYAEWEVETAGGGTRPLGELKTFELMNLPLPAVIALHARIHTALRADGAEATATFKAALPSVRKAGLSGLLFRYNACFPADPLRPPVVLASHAAHYGWAKGLDIVGLGADALRTLDVDQHLRLDMDALAEAVRDAAAHEEAVLMTVSICGTTEEGAVDPLHRVEALRADLAAEGLSFWHHADAAFGGYLTTMLPRDDDGRALPYDSDGPAGLLSEDVYRAVAALADVDSITIDPHKWGYVPYGAGALLCRDYRVRDAVAYAAPYIPTDEADGFGGFLGRWTLEGSRPGASAVSAYLSQAVVPLGPEGHGALVRDCVAASRALVAALDERFADGPLALRPLAEPDSVGFCFALVPRRGVRSLAALNAFTRRLWERVNVDGREDVGAYAFILSKTELPVGRYRHVLGRMLPGLAEDEPDEATVMLLRSFVLNPFVAAWNEREPAFAERFAETLHAIAAEVYPAHALGQLAEGWGRRLRVAVVEDDLAAPDALAHRLQHTPAYAAYLDVHAVVPGDAYDDADAVVWAASRDSIPDGAVVWDGGRLHDLTGHLVAALDDVIAA
ncbi:MAG: pyridoxal-dependent decarboxylase [Rhodothermales bacterium]